MQSPFIRTTLGFDYSDHQLDILVDPDRAWRWKDAHELKFAVERGRMTREEADSVQTEGIRAVSQIEENGSPFGEEWEHWTSPQSWSVPQLPDDWSDLSMYAPSVVGPSASAAAEQ